MDFFGIGPLELFFVVLIALIVLGPRDMVKAGRTLGRILRTVVQSDTWRTVLGFSRYIRNLPTQLMRDANLEDDVKTLQAETQQIRRELDMNAVKKDIQRAQQELAKESSDALADWTTPPEEEQAPSIRPPGIPSGAPPASTPAQKSPPSAAEENAANPQPATSTGDPSPANE